MLAPRKKLWSTPSSAVDIALDFADLGADDVVYDVGCGDGRVLIQMAAMSVLPALPAAVGDDDGGGGDSTDDQNNNGSNGNSNGSASASDDHHGHDREDRSQNIMPSNQSTSQTNTNNANPRQQQQQHRCQQFVGIEISPERADEARSNVLRAKRSNRIPSHVAIDIICANALDTAAVDYEKATVIFLYLVPRGLRLIRGIVWPECGGKGEQRHDAAVDDDASNGQSLQSSAAAAAGETKHGTKSTTTNNEIMMHQSSAYNKKRPRRIITYMAPFENTPPHVRKEYCKVDHQEGAAWPVFLYHVVV